MMNVKNQVQLIGYLGIDPEELNFEKGGKITKVSLATRELFKVQEKWKENTLWHKLILRGKLGERAKKTLKKGDKLMVNGKLSYRSYTNAQNQQVYITEIEVHNFILLNKKQITAA